MDAEQLEFSADETAVLAELRARLGLSSNADLIRVALWMYAHGQGLAPSAKLFAVGALTVRRQRRSTGNTP